MNRISNKLAVLCIALLAPILTLVVRLVWASETPDPLPTHWNASGQVNGTTAATPFFWWMLTISAVLALAAIAVVYLRRSRDAGRLLAAILVGGAWQVAAIYVLSVGLSHGADNAQTVTLPWLAVVLLVAFPLAIGVLVWFLLPLSAPAVQQLPHSSLQLSSNERVTWISHAHSTGIWIAATVLAVGGLVGLFFVVVPAVIAFGVAILLAGASEVAVRVDREGLHTLWGPLGWPRQVVHLDEIVRARAEIINPMRWGGWGYRVTSRGTAANIRTGPGIVVERTTGSSYVVTVDEAAQGADVLNALLVRERSTG